jgi:hypothetical protein
LKTYTFILLLLPLVSFSQFDSIDVPSAEYIHEIVLENGLCNGPGWDSISKHYKENQLFGLGEIHGTKEVASFFRQLLIEEKVDHYITEIDSLTMAIVSRDLAFSDTALAEHPGSYAMYSYSEERYLLADLKEQQTKFYGIDEVHPISMRILMAEMIKDPRITSKHQDKLKRFIADYNLAIEEGKVLDLISSKTRKKLKKLLQKIKRKDLEGKSSSIDFIEKHWHYYLMKTRSDLMKKTTKRVLSNVKINDSVKVVFKFGASHLAKTRNAARFKDVGYAVDAFAKSKDLTSYHLLTLIVEGNIALPAQMGGSKAISFDIRNDPFSAHLIPFGEVFDTESCLFFDLKGFSKMLETKDTILKPAFQKLLRDYDGVVMFREGTASPLTD